MDNLSNGGEGLPDGYGRINLMRVLNLPKNASSKEAQKRFAYYCRKVTALEKKISAHYQKTLTAADVKKMFRWLHIGTVIVDRLNSYSYIAKDLDLQDKVAAKNYCRASKLYAEFHLGVKPFEKEVHRGDWNFEDIKKRLVGKTIKPSEIQNQEGEEQKNEDNDILESEEKLDQVNLEFNQFVDNWPPPVVYMGKKEVKVDYTLFDFVLESPDRSWRQKAYRVFYQRYFDPKFMVVAENALNENFACKLRMAKAWGRKSVVEDVERDNGFKKGFFSLFCKKIHKSFLPLAKRYDGVRASILGLPISGRNCYTSWDAYVPVFAVNEAEFQFPNALELVEKFFKTKTSEKYLGIVKEIMDPFSGNIDVFPRKGKMSVSYCDYVQGQLPLILLNYQPSTFWISALVHELGHAVQRMYSVTQPMHKQDFHDRLIEIPATVNELLLYEYLIENAKSAEEAFFWEDAMIKRTLHSLVVDTGFSELECKLHERFQKNGGKISAKEANRISLRARERFSGHKVSRLHQAAWIFYSHIYNYNIYTPKYTYAVLVALLICDGIKSGRIAFEDYERFLSSGKSKTADEMLAELGISMQSDEAYEIVAQMLDRHISKLEGYCRTINEK